MAAQQRAGLGGAADVEDGELTSPSPTMPGAPVEVADLDAATLGRATHVRDDLAPDFDLCPRQVRAPVELAPGNWNIRLVATAPDGTEFRQRVVLPVGAERMTDRAAPAPGLGLPGLRRGPPPRSPRAAGPGRGARSCCRCPAPLRRLHLDHRARSGTDARHPRRGVNLTLKRVSGRRRSAGRRRTSPPGWTGWATRRTSWTPARCR
jgi:hypothetical protein